MAGPPTAEARALAKARNSCMVTANSIAGLYNSGGTFRTLGNNIVVDNDNNILGTITPIAGT